MQRQKVTGELDNTLARIKENIEKSYLYFKPNYDLYNTFRETVFDTAIDSKTLALLNTLKKPTIEFNILESYISRLRGEFSKQEPSIDIMAGDESQVDPNTIEVVKGHCKHILFDANRSGFEYNIYTDTLSGGFSVGKIWTEYANEKSFNQVIKIGRVYDPCLCGFDPLAKLPHKGDGNYCFELFPMLKEDFERQYPDYDVAKLSYSREIEGFSWSYKNAKDEILLIGDYYEKIKKKTKIVLLSTGQSMTEKKYKEFLKEYQEMMLIEQPPQVVDERISEIEHIDRYRIIENSIIEHKETNYKMLPLVFFDGNSIMLRNANDKSAKQMCRPYVYHARGIQKLKNFAGQTLANEFENMVQHKFKVAKEALPLEEDYLQAYKNVQQADVLVYNAFNELAPDKPLPPPEVVQRVPIPQELVATFTGADAMTQNILGSFDMDIARLNQSQVSGIALQEAATQNNSAAMPYIVGFLQGLGRLMECAVDLIPKYFKTPRTLPIVLPDGKKDYVPINQQPGVNLQYDENALNVRVEPGVNFGIQKTRALNQIIALQQASPLFQEFMNTEGLDILLDNIEIKGIDTIKQKAKAWQQQMQQMKQQQMNQPNPVEMKMQIEQAKMQQKAQESQSKLQLDLKKLEADQIKIMADLKQSHESSMVQILKAQTEKFAKEIDLQLKHMDITHKHRMDHHKALKELRNEHEKRTS